MRCERVIRPTLRGVKRAEDSVKDDICLESSHGSRDYGETWSEAGNRSGWLGSNTLTSHFLYSQDSTEIYPTWRVGEVRCSSNFRSWPG